MIALGFGSLGRFALVLCGGLLFGGQAFAADVPKELNGAGIVEKLGSAVPVSEITLRDEAGAPVVLGSLFRPGKPVILSLVYYECPNLCTLVLTGLLNVLKETIWLPGDQFDVITVSINPKEGADLAHAKKQNYLKSLGKPISEMGWRFLTGEEAQVRRLADSVGFGYRWDQESQQYAHSAALFALTPDGVLSRILYGVQFRPQDLKLALVEASRGKVGSVVDRILLFCYRYDPVTRKYSLVLTRVMQLASAGMILVMGLYLSIFWWKQRRESSVPTGQ
jgi:protein SCO1/2